MGRKRVLAALRTAFAVPTFLLFTFVVSSIIIVLSYVRPDTPLIDRIIRGWSRLFLTTGPITMETSGQENIDPNQQYVFVANHLSNFDIPVMFRTVPKPIRYLAKKEVYKIPFVAQAMNRVGIIKTDRDAGPAAHAMINEGVAKAKARGHSLIIFPEGTRSRDGSLGSFKKGAFRIAIANGLPVVPVSILGTWEVWQPNALIFYPGHAITKIHEPIPTADLDFSDITALRDKVHAIIAADIPKALGGSRD